MLNFWTVFCCLLSIFKNTTIFLGMKFVESDTWFIQRWRKIYFGHPGSMVNWPPSPHDHPSIYSAKNTIIFFRYEICQSQCFIAYNSTMMASWDRLAHWRDIGNPPKIFHSNNNTTRQFRSEDASVYCTPQSILLLEKVVGSVQEHCTSSSRSI